MAAIDGTTATLVFTGGGATITVPLSRFRWKAGVLQQLWAITTYGTSFSDASETNEWRDVPSED
jgi:hypothetical protein